MTRTKAILWSFFGPFLVLFPVGMVIAILVGEAHEASTADSTRKVLYAIAIVLGIAALIGGFAIRIKHAGWYVRDKKQPEGWKWISLLGIWGLIVLLILPDRAALASPTPGASPGIAPAPAYGSAGLSNWVAYLLIGLGVLLVGLMIWNGFHN